MSTVVPLLTPTQLARLPERARAYRVPSAGQIYQAARALPEAERMQVVGISERAAVVSGLEDEQPRYYLQHALGFQMHDARHPHHAHRHGRADIGRKDAPRDD
jgi:hypothetical protein